MNLIIPRPWGYPLGGVFIKYVKYSLLLAGKKFIISHLGQAQELSFHPFLLVTSYRETETNESFTDESNRAIAGHTVLLSLLLGIRETKLAL
jgi:hypothetical protein